nr:thioredoxin family protein [uncultured Cetobacterium sp.]
MRLYLFTTPTCQYCAPAKEALKTIKNPVEFLNAEEHMDLVQEYGIRTVPTLVVKKCKNVEILVGLDKIQNFVEENKNREPHSCGCSH